MFNRLTSAFTLHACAVILATVCAGSASAQQVKSGDLVLDNAWSRATPGGAKVGGGYLTVDNKGSTADKLLGGSSPAAGKVEVHEMAMNNGVMTLTSPAFSNFSVTGILSPFLSGVFSSTSIKW